MSFILDALRKSESERQQEASPSITRIPSAVPSRALPAWAIGTIAALGLGVVVLAGAWWMTLEGQRQGVRAQAAAPSGEPTAPSASTPDPRTTDTRSVEIALPPPRRTQSPAAEQPSSTPRGFSAAARSAPSGLRQAVSEAASAPAVSEPARSAQSRPAVQTDPLAPSYASQASNLGLPALRLELLAFSDVPAERFVFINGARYAEGDTLPGGSRILEIDRQGAVLLAEGRQLRLSQE